MTFVRDFMGPVISILANLWLLYLSVKWMRRYEKLLEEHFKLRIEMTNVESDLWWERCRKDMEAAISGGKKDA